MRCVLLLIAVTAVVPLTSCNKVHIEGGHISNAFNQPGKVSGEFRGQSGMWTGFNPGLGGGCLVFQASQGRRTCDTDVTCERMLRTNRIVATGVFPDGSAGMAVYPYCLADGSNGKGTKTCWYKDVNDLGNCVRGVETRDTSWQLGVQDSHPISKKTATSWRVVTCQSIGGKGCREPTAEGVTHLYRAGPIRKFPAQ